MNQVSTNDVKELNILLFNKKMSDKKAEVIAKRINKAGADKRLYLIELLYSSDFMKVAQKNILDFHLFFTHHARLQLISSLLPKAKQIVDLGGANGSIYEMGYPHKFKKITVIDLPPNERDPMYKNLKLKPKKTPSGTIKVHFGDMCNMNFLRSNTIDMVWSGESIEHVDALAGAQMIKEAYRILKPGGFFCLDTPNRIITEIHTAWNGGGFIHPEHKIEYYPEQLQAMLYDGGFDIVDRRGVREMPRTYATKQFDYSDFILGNPLPNNIESAYIQYYCCKKPIRAKKLQNKLKENVSKIKHKIKRPSAKISR
jgi:SAM-dependent methyltransferase